MKLVVFDVETTGLQSKVDTVKVPAVVGNIGSEVIQIGGLVLNEEAEVESAFCHYCDCMAADSEEAAFNVHGIQVSDIRRHIPNVFLGEVLVKWLPFFFDRDVTFIGYNVTFDLKMTKQSLRNFSIPFKSCQRVVTKIPEQGRHYVDVMAYLPHRVKLSSFEDSLAPQREAFFRKYAHEIRLQTNIPEMLRDSWETAHNSLFDSLETYLLFMQKVWHQKVFKGGGIHSYRN